MRDLVSEIQQIHKVRTEIVPVVIGALGTVPKLLAGNPRKFCVPDVIGCQQTSVLLGYAPNSEEHTQHLSPWSGAILQFILLGMNLIFP